MHIFAESKKKYNLTYHLKQGNMANKKGENGIADRKFSSASKQDLILVDRVKSGDKKAFDVLYSRYSPFIRHYIFERVHNQRTVEDMTHDVLMKVYANIHKFRVEYTFSSWVWRILKNYMVDYYRKDPRTTLSTSRNLGISCEDQSYEEDGKSVVYENTLSGPGFESDLRVRARERRDYVKDLLGVVNERERRVIELYFFEGKSYEEISQELEVPMNTMKVLMLRAKDKMRRHIGSFDRIEGLLS